MATNYTVKKGDTLSAIAKALGTEMSNISGYSSGNANLIRPGEVLTIGPKERASAMADELGGSTTGKAGGNTKGTTTGTTAAPTDSDLLTTYKTTMETAGKNKEKAFNDLKDYRTNTYNSLVTERGLPEIKSKIDDLDSQIGTLKSQRDEAIARASDNPFASAATITGEVGKLTDKQNAAINNLIEQRNGLSTSYNDTLGEIDKIVNNGAKDLEDQYNFYADEETKAQNLVTNYATAIRNELEKDEEYQHESDRNKVEDQQWAAELAQQLAIAQLKDNGSGSGSYNLQLITDPNTGNPKGLFDPRKGTVSPVPGSTSTSQSTGYDAIQQEAAPAAQKKGTWIGNLLRKVF